jgi:hypothetical protein
VWARHAVPGYGCWLLRLVPGRERYGVRISKLVRLSQGVEDTVIKRVDLDLDDGVPVLAVQVRPTAARRSRCSRCGRRCPGEDQGGGTRSWRALDMGVMKVATRCRTW